MSDLDEILYAVLVSDKPLDEKRKLVTNILAENKGMAKLTIATSEHKLDVTLTRWYKLKIGGAEKEIKLEMPALAIAVNNDLELVKLLINAGYFLSQALGIATVRLQAPIIRFLLIHGANMDLKIKFHNSYGTEEHTSYDMAIALKQKNESTIVFTFEAWIALMKAVKSFLAITTKETPLDKTSAYAGAIGHFYNACSNDITLVIDYLTKKVTDLVSKKKEKNFLALKVFTEHTFHFINNPYFPCPEVYSYFCNHLLAAWKSYSPKEGGQFSQEQLTAFLKSLQLDLKPLEAKSEHPATSSNTAIAPITDTLLALTKTSSPINSSITVDSTTTAACVTPKDSPTLTVP